MKAFKLIGFSVITLIIICSFQSNQKSVKQASELIGTYEYTGNLVGYCIMNENNFTWACRAKLNKPDSLLTLQERYNALNSAAGLWTVKDSIVTCTFKYHTNPKLVGTSFRYVYNLKGNKCTYRIIDKDGKTTGTGSSIKIQ